MSNKIVKDLNQGSVTKTMILFALPMLFAGLIQMLYNTADMIIVGRFVGTAGGSSGLGDALPVAQARHHKGVGIVVVSIGNVVVPLARCIVFPA